MTASAFARDFSIEATRPSASEIAQLGEILPARHVGLCHGDSESRPG